MRFLLSLWLVLVLAACSGSGTATTSIDDYVDDYGGSRSVYAEILADTSCTTLQATFDRAAANNDTAAPGSAEARWTTGYMAAANDRMQEIGCY